MALLGEYIRGEITDPQLKSYIEETLTQNNSGVTYTLDGDCLADINTIISTIDALPDSPSKILYAFKFRHVFEIAETDCSLYSTQAEVKARLNFI
jgi:hypothetical protein